MTRHILMGDPAYFRILRGANPHTRTPLGFKKTVDVMKAIDQWQAMKAILESYGIVVHVIPAHEDMPGLVFPANAGFVPDLDTPMKLSDRFFVLSRLNEARSSEAGINEACVKALGMNLSYVLGQFEGQADLIQWGNTCLFTYGKLETPRFVPRLGIPPWRRVYGFRSDINSLAELKAWVPQDKTISLELCDERYYHGDTILYAFGPAREYLLLYEAGLTPASRKRLGKNPNIIPLSDVDAMAYAANSFQLLTEDECVLFMPKGISSRLLGEIESRAIKVVTLDVSEFLEKGGGSVKCMIGDLGQVAD